MAKAVKKKKATPKKVITKKASSKPKSNWGYKFLFVLLLLGAGIAIYYTLKNYKTEQEAKFAFYPSFGIRIPENFEIHGIDVSKHQSNINWQNVKEMKANNVAVNFAFIKATEGISSKDSKFSDNWNSARQLQIPCGAYHFFIPQKSPQDQANNFINSVPKQTGMLPPVVDIEELYGTPVNTVRENLKSMLELLEQHYGVKPIIYTYASFYKSYLGEMFDEYPLWVAHYHSGNKPDILRDWLFWQHSEDATINGITQKVDFNVFNGDKEDFDALLIK